MGGACFRTGASYGRGWTPSERKPLIFRVGTPSLDVTFGLEHLIQCSKALASINLELLLLG